MESTRFCADITEHIQMFKANGRSMSVCPHRDNLPRQSKKAAFRVPGSLTQLLAQKAEPSAITNDTVPTDERSASRQTYPTVHHPTDK